MTANHVRSRGRRAKKPAGVSGGSQWRQRAGAAPGRTATATVGTVESTRSSVDMASTVSGVGVSPARVESDRARGLP